MTLGRALWSFPLISYWQASHFVFIYSRKLRNSLCCNVMLFVLLQSNHVRGYTVTLTRTYDISEYYAQFWIIHWIIDWSFWIHVMYTRHRLRLPNTMYIFVQITISASEHRPRHLLFMIWRSMPRSVWWSGPECWQLCCCMKYGCSLLVTTLSARWSTSTNCEISWQCRRCMYVISSAKPSYTISPLLIGANHERIKSQSHCGALPQGWSLRTVLCLPAQCQQMSACLHKFLLCILTGSPGLSFRILESCNWP